MQTVFVSNNKVKNVITDDTELIDKLYKQIGKLSTECEWLKKNLRSLNHERRKSLIDYEHEISLTRQCELLSISRSCLYYKPRQLNVLTIIDKIYTGHPYFWTFEICP
jgi:putative transposase